RKGEEVVTRLRRDPVFRDPLASAARARSDERNTDGLTTTGWFDGDQRGTAGTDHGTSRRQEPARGHQHAAGASRRAPEADAGAGRADATRHRARAAGRVALPGYTCPQPRH